MTTTRRGGWPGPRKPKWTFRPTAEAAAGVAAYIARHDLDPERGRSRAINALLAQAGLPKEGDVSGTASQTSLTALAETVRWEIAETLDKCAGTKERILDQIKAGEDCDTCPPGFLAVVMQAERLARALGIALDLLGVPTIDEAEAAR